jgi:hypothetical protein
LIKCDVFGVHIPHHTHHSICAMSGEGGQGGEREATGAGGTAPRLVPQTRAGVLTCAVVGGTHGNELTGVALVGKWTRQAHAAPLSLTAVPEVQGPPPPSTGSHTDTAPGTGSASGGPRCTTGDGTPRATGASTSHPVTTQSGCAGPVDPHCAASRPGFHDRVSVAGQHGGGARRAAVRRR